MKQSAYRSLVLYLVIFGTGFITLGKAFGQQPMVRRMFVGAEEWESDKWVPVRSPTTVCVAEVVNVNNKVDQLKITVDDCKIVGLNAQVSLKLGGKSMDGRRLSVEEVTQLLKTPRTVLCGLEPDEPLKSILSKEVIWLDIPGHIEEAQKSVLPPRVTIRCLPDPNGDRIEMRCRPQKRISSPFKMRYQIYPADPLSAYHEIQRYRNQYQDAPETRMEVDASQLSVFTVDGRTLDAKAIALDAMNSTSFLYDLGEGPSEWMPLLRGDAMLVRVRKSIKPHVVVGKPHRDAGRFKSRRIDPLGLDPKGRLIGKFGLLNRYLLASNSERPPGFHELEVEGISETSCRLKLPFLKDKVLFKQYIAWPINPLNDEPQLVAAHNEQCIWNIYESVRASEADGWVIVDQNYVPAIDFRDDECLQMDSEGIVRVRPRVTSETLAIKKMLEGDVGDIRNSPDPKIMSVRSLRIYDNLRDGL